MKKVAKNEFQMQLGGTKYGTPDVSKKGAVQAAVNLYSSIMESGASAIQIAEMFKFIETVSEKLKELSDENGRNSFVELVREEIEKNSDDGKSLTTKYGTKFELFEAASKFDYSTCGDPIWNQLNAEFVSTKEKKEEREAYLKGLKKSQVFDNLMDPYTGEIHENVQIFPPVKKSTSTYKQTIVNG